jgi:type II secretory pathway pseudopilin PulG
MEMLTVVAIIAILLVMVVPGFNYLRTRAERGSCMNNLKGIYVAATLYVQDHGQWPQIDPKTLHEPSYPQAWVDAFRHYNISERTWLCPSIQRVLSNPDTKKPENRRIDYFGTPFGPDRTTPYKYKGQPWFIERGDMHGDGQLLIFRDGTLKSLKDVLRDTQVQHIE